MWPLKRWTDRDALSRYWNALVHDAPPEELTVLASALDADQLAVIERLHGRERYRPDPRFVARLERDLLRDVAPAHTEIGWRERLVLWPTSGLFPPRPRVSSRPRVVEPRRWELAPLITALLVAVTLAAAYVAFIPRRDEVEELVPVVAPATPATPAVEASPAAEASPQVTPFWRTLPVPPVAAEFQWSITGPASTGTGFSSQIAVDPNDNVWVIDGANGRFLIYEPDGTFLETWGEPGASEGQFDFQRDSGEALGSIAFTPFHADEDFYIADSQNARIQQFDADRNFVRTWGERGTGDGQFLEPISVSVSFDGFIYVVDGQRDDVQVFDADGTFVSSFGGHGAADGQFDRAGGAGFNPHGHYWIADTGNDRIQRINTYPPDVGKHDATFGSSGSGEGELDQPLAVAFDEDARLYIADRGNHRVQVLDSEDRFVSVIDAAASGGTAFVNPTGVVVDWEGNLYVLDDDGTTVTVQKFRLLLP